MRKALRCVDAKEVGLPRMRERAASSEEVSLREARVEVEGICWRFLVQRACLGVEEWAGMGVMVESLADEDFLESERVNDDVTSDKSSEERVPLLGGAMVGRRASLDTCIDFDRWTFLDEARNLEISEG